MSYAEYDDTYGDIADYIERKEEIDTWKMPLKMITGMNDLTHQEVDDINFILSRNDELLADDPKWESKMFGMNDLMHLDEDDINFILSRKNVGVYDFISDTLCVSIDSDGYAKTQEMWIAKKKEYKSLSFIVDRVLEVVAKVRGDAHVTETVAAPAPAGSPVTETVAAPAPAGSPVTETVSTPAVSDRPPWA